LHIKTQLAEEIVEVDRGHGHQFVAFQYGIIRTKHPKVKELVIAKGKRVGVVSTSLKGKVFLYTFDIASGGDFRRLIHMESVLSELKLTTPVYVSDPNIEVVLHRGDSSFVIFLLAPPPGELADATDIRTKDILLKVDLRKAGFKGTRLQLTDQFAEEGALPIKTSVDELKSGISLTIGFPDARILLVEKV
jgi:hypothetical protein